MPARKKRTSITGTKRKFYGDSPKQKPKQKRLSQMLGWNQRTREPLSGRKKRKIEASNTVDTAIAVDSSTDEDSDYNRNHNSKRSRHQNSKTKESQTQSLEHSQQSQKSSLSEIDKDLLCQTPPEHYLPSTNETPSTNHQNRNRNQNIRSNVECIPASQMTIPCTQERDDNDVETPTTPIFSLLDIDGDDDDVQDRIDDEFDAKNDSDASSLNHNENAEEKDQTEIQWLRTSKDDDAEEDDDDIEIIESNFSKKKRKNWCLTIPPDLQTKLEQMNIKPSIFKNADTGIKYWGAMLKSIWGKAVTSRIIKFLPVYEGRGVGSDNTNWHSHVYFYCQKDY